MTKLPLAATLLLLATSSAWAQSKRYPPEPVDKDKENAARSALWENATNPNNQPYRALVAEAKQALGGRTDDQSLLAVQKLDQAIALQPNERDAYALRGEAFRLLRRWDRCAADLQTATLKTPPDETLDKRAALEQQRNLGLCLAQAGKLADAERVLAEATATGTGTGEMLMRLGEIRIAMGKLDEAIGALSAALETTDTPSQSLTRWLLASAYDRARRPADAVAEARRAASYDRGFGSITGGTTPLLGAGEADYLLGLAWSSIEAPRAELALFHFRHFVKAAPDSPWRKRAEEHLRDLKVTALPEVVERKAGGAGWDEAIVLATVKKAMPAMRACMAKAPETVLEVTITRVGPRTKLDPNKPQPNPYRARYMPRPIAPPPESVNVAPFNGLPMEDPRAASDTAARCIEPLATRLVLPAIKDKDTWYRLAFLVIAP